MIVKNKASKITLLNFTKPEMRAFHMTWFSFFLCFFGWFGIAPLMAIVKNEFGLSKSQIGMIAMSSVSATVFARLAIGWVCDWVGPRTTYTWLLILGSIPVMTIGLASNYETLLISRLLIGIIGASFVITQFHTSIMFAPNCVGTANATSAGWGNLGGGVTQLAMPLIFSFFLLLTNSNSYAWRLSMIIPGILMIITGILYHKLTQDSLDGNFKDLKLDKNSKRVNSKTVFTAIKDPRVWALFIVYGACFGVELTMNNFLALYFGDSKTGFNLDLKTAGILASLFGLMNIFARTLGGFFGDKFGVKYGLKGRVRFLLCVMLLEGIALILFSQANHIVAAIFTLIIFSIFVQMAEGATFAVVPFINKKALGPIAGIVGAGGNVGAVCATFLFKSEEISYQNGFLYLGIAVCITAFTCTIIRFSKEDERAVQEEMSLYKNKSLQVS